MQKLTLKRNFLAATLLFVLALSAPALVNAETKPAQDGTMRPKVESTTPIKEPVGSKPSEPTPDRKEDLRQDKAATAEAKQARLDEKKLQACQKREQKINDIMAKMSERGSKQLAVFNKISDRTQDFYTEKGRTVSNYDALLADLTAKNAAAEAAIASTKDSSVTFKCDGTDPKGASAGFKQSLVAQKQALKDYKTSVKNLIQAVKSAQSTSTDKPEANTSEGTQQ